MIGKIVSRKSKKIGSKIESIFSESKQIIFLVSFVQLKLELIFTYISHYIQMDDGLCTSSLSLRVLYAFIELSVKFCSVTISK